MMDILFDNFFELTLKFIQLGRHASTRQSEYGIKHNQPSGEQIELWHSLVGDVEQSTQRLYRFVGLGVDENRDSIDLELETYRELPRKMDYYDCHWSAYYPEIQKLNSQIAIKLGEIDREYTLGKYLIREKIAKYQS